ncbi:hypothetical protein LJC29_05210, partial [Bacteroides sp. OttesenSCG-928-N06]|nr:hypothetical protein [Bacteroides sp. OttesenSCG-928-N06]
ALALSVKGQSIMYHHLKDFVTNSGDTIALPAKLYIEKRSRAHQLTQAGGDRRISSNRDIIKNRLKRYYAVQVDENLYVNCRRLKIKKFKFGKFYAPAMLVKDKIYFSAVPIGPAAVAVVDREIGMGAIGEAIASSSAISKRVYYDIDMETGKVNFVGKERMTELLTGYPDLLEAYLLENNEEAKVTGRYLRELKQRE